MLKEFFNTDRLSLKVGKVLSHLPISPNQWTIISVIPAIVAFWSIISGEIVLGALLFFFSAIVDGFDGGLARYTNRSTKLGAFLDGNTDRFVDFLVVYSLLFLGLPDFLIPVEHWVVIMMFLAVLPSFTVAYANHRGAVPDPNEKEVWRILNRPEMFILWMLVMFTSVIDVQISMYLLVITVILSFITTLQTKILAIIKSKRFSREAPITNH